MFDGGMTRNPSIRLVGTRWRLLVEGDERPLKLQPWRRPGLDYLITRLLAGGDVSLSALESYGIKVRHLGDEVEIIEVPPL